MTAEQAFVARCHARFGRHFEEWAKHIVGAKRARSRKARRVWAWHMMIAAAALANAE